MNDIEQNFRLLEFPNGALIIQKKTSSSWKTDFSIPPLKANVCLTCGHPLLEEQKCKYHSELKNIPTIFSLCYGGYYQTDINFKALNEYTKRIQRFHQCSHDVPIFLAILKSRWEKIPDKEDYKWLTHVPSQNSNMETIAQLFAKDYSLKYISCQDIFNYIPITSIKYQQRKKKRRELIKSKYHLNIDQIKNYERYLSGSGILMDDIFNSGMTMAYLINLLSKNIKLGRIKGIVLARTKGKTIDYLKLPNI